MDSLSLLLIRNFQKKIVPNIGIFWNHLDNISCICLYLGLAFPVSFCRKFQHSPDSDPSMLTHDPSSPKPGRIGKDLHLIKAHYHSGEGKKGEKRAGATPYHNQQLLGLKFHIGLFLIRHPKLASRGYRLSKQQPEKQSTKPSLENVE